MRARHESLITHLVDALNVRARLHADHPDVRAAVDGFVRELRDYMAAESAQRFFVGVAGDQLTHKDEPLVAASLAGRKLIDFATNLRCGGFYFRPDTEERDVLGLLDLHVQLKRPTANMAEACELLRTRTERILLSPPFDAPGWFGRYDFEQDQGMVDMGMAPTPAGRGAGAGAGTGWATAGGADGAGPGAGGAGAAGSSAGASVRAAAGVFRALFDAVESAHESAAASGVIDVNGTRGLAQGLVRSSAAALHDALRVVEYPNYDTYTVGHSVRVALLGVQVGRALGMAERVLIELGTAGLLHDVGKARIPHEILFKPARLDDDERRVMSQHPLLGAEILIDQRAAGAPSVGAAYGHHLRHDRRGYPRVPRWYSIGTSTAIIQVADVFEALTAIRPYKPSLSPRRAFEIMAADEGAFHPAAFAALVRSMGLYPPGTRVELSSGERGTVLLAGVDLERPRVRVTHDAKGRSLPESEQLERDLSEATEAALRVVRSIESVRKRVKHDADAHDTCC